MAPEALDVLQRYEFPGNVRELENILEHAFILCKGRTIRKHHLPSYLFGLEKELEQLTGKETSMRDLESQAILRALKKHHGNKALAAKELGIHRTTLWRKLKRMGL
jgi:transcriptional regulator with PAS, ATPase and Fis domain